ncbi:calcium-binding protein [Xylella fastidiosa]|uniref:calcium-binding protein n=1 Tax=Xylella fastidiosa TaxID=2371 RepID=UPI001F3F6E52|nr:calcium-binding protein [Xylella fastidiosa]UIT40690.1 calcium-binding protein [Xylella fastidiosa subsp. multiplex]
MSDNTAGKAASDLVDYNNINNFSSAYATGVIAFTQEYQNQYSIMIRSMDPQKAIIQSLVAAHQHQADLYWAYSDRANRAGNAVLRDMYADAALGAAYQTRDLSLKTDSAQAILNSHYDRARSGYSALIEASPALRNALKYAGIAGDLAGIGNALMFGGPGDVAKALGIIAIGLAAGSLVGLGAAAIGATGLGAAVAAGLAATLVQLTAEYLIPQAWWESIENKSKETFKDLFDQIRRFTPRRDPLVLDLDGDGIETVAAGKHILFDHDGDGIKHASGWVKPDDGFLVLDRNGNGRIDDGSELFGADTVLANGHKATSGFEALRDLDSNGDGLFDAADARFTDVRVWRDLNQDGQSQANELFTLSSLGIASITLTPTNTEDVDLGNGNLIDNRGTYTRTDGRTGVVGDLQLGLEHFYRDYSGAKEQVTVTDAAAALPHLTGSGAVRDLREAASLSPALLAAVQALTPGTTRDTMRTALDPLVALWAGTSTMPSTEQRLETSGAVPRTVYYHGAVPAAVTAQGKEAVQAWIQQQHARLGPIIAILEKFNGSSLVSERNGQVSTGGETFTWNRVIHPDGHSEDVMSILLQPEQINSLMSAYASLKESAYAGLVLGTRLSDYLSGLTLTYSNDAFGWDASALEAKLDHTWQRNKTQALQDVMDLYRYGSNAVAASGWKPFDALRHMIDRAAATPDGRQALAAAEITLVSGSAEGSAAADLMFGDTGANILRGGAGDDVLSGGDGDDTLYGGDGNDILHGDAGNDTLYGGGGNDLLLGGAGDDVLDGGEGSNRLEGGAGNDVLKVSYWSADNVLNGGTGDDTLYGSGYADTYIFNKGDGHDTIIEQGGTDKLVFGEGIAAADVRLLRQGQDVVLDLGNGHDSIRLKDWLTAEGRRNYSADIEQIVFADGTLWTPETLSSMGLTTLGTSGNDTLKGWQGKDILLGGAGDDVLDGGEGSNRLDGGAGNDVLKVSYWSADNVLNGGTGDDTLYGSGYADTYIFNKGDGHDTIIEQGGTDKLVFGEGIAAADVRLLRQGQDVVLDLGNGHDSIRLKDWLTAEGRRNYSADIEQIVFADGTLWTPETLSSMGLTTLGTSGNDILKGTDVRDSLLGGDGDDTLYGGGGNDLLLGGAGDDVLDGGEGSNRLEGGAGNDVLKVSYWSADNVLNGGTGDDTLYGSGYADTYIFNKGDGHDTIIEQGGTDKLVFGEGIAAADVRLLRQGQDVVLDLGNGHDSIRLKDWLTAEGRRNYSADIEQIVFADGTLWTPETLSSMGLTTLGTSGNDTLKGWQGKDILLGGAGDDVLDGGEGSNRLDGGAGNDVLKVSYWSADNVLNGGTGDDTLYGSGYADTYIFNKGDGHDTIIEQGGTDKLVFGEGIAAADVRLLRQGQDVVLDLGNGHDSIRLKDWLTAEGRRNYSADIEQIVFADGTLWTPETLSSMGLTTLGTSGNDTLKGWQGKDILLGGAGDDVLDGGEGSNRLEGGAGNDVLKVSYWSADNVLNGGTGDDTLYGSGYADTYIFNKGDGHDTIIEQGGTDKLVFGEGIAAADVRLLRQGQDVVLDLGNGHDSIRLKDWLTAEGRRNYSADIEQIVFADGTLWTPETLSSMGLTTLGTSGNDTLKGWQGKDILLGGAGDDVLDGGEGSNRLEGGAGNDVLKVSYWSADNVLNGGTGDDTLYGSGYADTYIFNKGDGHDTIIEQGGIDKLVFGEGIAAADVRLLRQGQDVVLDLGNGHDSIRLKDWLTAEGRRNYSADIEQIVFADGTLWTPETLSSMGLTTLGTSGNDTLKGWQGKDILLGGAGDDVLDGGEGSNRLEGGAGNDVLKVSYWSADNVLNGGTGDDTLYGSGYADTYIFNKGDGHDTIIEQGGTDKLVFGEGLHQKDARFTKSGNDLSILLNGGVDQVTVAGWFSAAAHQVESLVFQDGTVLSGEVERLIAAMALSPAVTTMQASVRDIKESPRLVASSIV